MLAGNKSKGALPLLERSAQKTRQKLLSLKHVLCRHKVFTPVLYFCVVFFDHINYITAGVVIAGKFKERLNIRGYFALAVCFLFTAFQIFHFLGHTQIICLKFQFMRDLLAILALEILCSIAPLAAHSPFLGNF